MSVRNLKKVSRAPASAVELLAMPEREYKIGRAHV